LITRPPHLILSPPQAAFTWSIGFRVVGMEYRAFKLALVRHCYFHCNSQQEMVQHETLPMVPSNSLEFAFDLPQGPISAGA
jgi:hypothetical protein